MTQQPPPDPRPSRRELGFDELVAIVAAFLALGSVLWWGLSRTDQPVSFLEEQGLPNLAPVVPEAPPLVPAPLEQAIDRESPAEPEATVTPAPEASPAPAAVAEPRSRAVVPYAVPISPAASPTPAVAPPAGLVVPSPTAAAVEFTDVPANYWASPFIVALAQRGIISGSPEGTFQPERPITRAEYAALIESIFQQPGDQTAIPFRDVPANFWATPAIDTAVKSGFMKGYPNGEFQPNQEISHVQVLASLTNGLQVAPPAAPTETITLYQDGADIPSWAVPATAAATQAGIVVNYPQRDLLRPNQPATRAEVAAMIHQALVAAGKLEPIQSDYIVRP